MVEVLNYYRISKSFRLICVISIIFSRLAVVMNLIQVLVYMLPWTKLMLQNLTHMRLCHVLSIKISLSCMRLPQVVEQILNFDIKK